MKLIVPNYYVNFRCIAEACRHNCCIGWEIDIDEDTLIHYQTLGGELGKRLKESISPENTPHFILGAEERCPFLNGDNLCDLITELGEDGLCQICADHPRFRNYFADRTEMGLGLCCEAAVKLILNQQRPVTLTVLENDGVEETADPVESAFFRLREQVFAALQNREFPMETRLLNMLELCGGSLPSKPVAEWAQLYQGLERLDPAWDERLQNMASTPSLSAQWEIPLEQLAVYFAYRHLAGALNDGRLAERAAFIALSVKMIQHIAGAEEDLTLEKLAEIARQYSSEIEYSDENMEILLNSVMN